MSQYQATRFVYFGCLGKKKLQSPHFFCYNIANSPIQLRILSPFIYFINLTVYKLSHHLKF